MKYKNRGAAPSNLVTKTELKRLRWTLADAQRPVGYYWQGHGYVALYDPVDAVPMRAARETTPAQAEALSAGRALAKTALCLSCNHRVDKTELGTAACCCDCMQQAEWDSREGEQVSLRDLTAEMLALEPLFLDTETTGLDDQAEVIEIAILDRHGTVLLDTLVRPAGTIPREASAINGITDGDVAGAPQWSEVGEKVAAILARRLVVAHGAEFDSRMLHQTSARYGVPMPPFRVECTMELLTELNGRRWPSLRTAARIAGAQVSSGRAHRAKSDAETCRQIVLALACQLES